MEIVKPVSPDQLANQDEHDIHPSMIRAINILLSRFDGYSLNLTQREIVEKFLNLEPNMKRSDVFDNNYLDFIGIYRRAGWDIVYDRPGYNESYEPNYTFKKSK